METSRSARRWAASAGALLLGVSCTGGGAGRPAAPEVTGPAAVRSEVVAEHAEQFDVDLQLRPAGSEEEQAAAAYILGILQQNGYFVRLESVPVADLFTSTNVIAQPASGDDPGVMVVLPYSNSGDVPSNGLALGLFLEVARAQNVADPQHPVQFVAVGAEYAEAEGGSLGSRRLAQLLLDEDKDPFIIQIIGITQSGPFQATGDRADEAMAVAEELGATGDTPLKDLPLEPDVFKSAGFERLVVSGGVDAVGEVLLEFLRAQAG